MARSSVCGSSGPRDASRDALGDASSGLAIRRPPKALDKLRSPFMAAEFESRKVCDMLR
jgi:hypothetical protein